MSRHLLLPLASLLLAGCGVEVGNRHLASQPRTVSAFSKVAVHDGISLEYFSGERAISVTTDENLLPLVETFVEGDTLVLRLTPGKSVHTSSGLRVSVSNETLVGLEASGGSKLVASATTAPEWPIIATGGSTVTVSSLAVATVRISASGGSQVRVSGVAQKLVADASGGSKVIAEGLYVVDATLHGSGGSRFNVRASGIVDGELSGGSTLTLWDHPSYPNLSTSGGSQVSEAYP